jgi:hypothetical protein
MGLLWGGPAKIIRCGERRAHYGLGAGTLKKAKPKAIEVKVN